MVLGGRNTPFFFFCLIYTHFYIFPLRMFGYRSVRVCLCDFILRSLQLNFWKVVLPTIPPLYPQIHVGKGFPWNQAKLVQFFSVYTHKSVQQTAKNPARLHRTCWAWLEAFLAWMGEVRLNLAWQGLVLVWMHQMKTQVLHHINFLIIVTVAFADDDILLAYYEKKNHIYLNGLTHFILKKEGCFFVTSIILLSSYRACKWRK